MADIEDAALRPGHNAGDHHAFDHQVRQMGHDEAVFDRARLAFIGIAYDILHGIGLLPHQIPLHARRKAGAAHSAKFGGFELCEDVVPCAGLDELAHDAVFLVVTVAIRVGFARDARLLGMRLVDFFAAKGAASHLLGARGTNLGKNLIVDRYCRRALAPAEAGNVTNLHVFGAGAGKATLQLHAQLASAVEMATHVRADANFGFGRRREVKMRVETRDAVKLVERSVRALGKSFQLRRGQKAVAQLDGPKVVEDHVVRSRAQIAAQASWNTRRGSGC